MDLPIGCKISEARVHYTSHFGLRRVRAGTLQPAAVPHAVTSVTLLEKRFSFSISDQCVDVVEWATDALIHIAQWEDGARGIVDADETLNPVWDLLESGNPNVREWSCYLMGTLAGHEFIVPTILELEPCVPLVCLLW
jgi:hypothetical protein